MSHSLFETKTGHIISAYGNGRYREVNREVNVCIDKSEMHENQGSNNLFNVPVYQLPKDLL